MSDFNKEFKVLLQEDIPQHFPSPGNAEVGLDQKEQTRMLEHINDVLAPLTSTATVNPYYMVQRIKDRLKLALELTFDDAYFLGNTGTKECHLIATDMVHAKDKSGLYHVDHPYLKFFPGGLILKFQFLKIGNVYHVDARVVNGQVLQVSVT
jgi:hypothetical protein